MKQKIEKLVAACNARYGNNEDKLWQKFLEYLTEHFLMLDNKLLSWIREEDYQTVAIVIADNYIVNGEIITRENFADEYNCYLHTYKTFKNLCNFYPIHTENECLTRLGCYIFDDIYDVCYPNLARQMQELLYKQPQPDVPEYYIRHNGMMVRLHNKLRLENTYFCNLWYGSPKEIPTFNITTPGQLYAVMAGPQLWPVYDRMGNIITDPNKGYNAYDIMPDGKLKFLYKE